jgi:Domain of unknown function (DUF4032)
MSDDLLDETTADASGDPEDQRAAATDAVREAAVPRGDWARLRALPWGAPLEEWPERGVATLNVRRGESRHVVIFVEVGHRRYAIKETSPGAAAHESDIFAELRRRGVRTLEPVGHVITHGEPIPAGELAGRTLYLSGDTGYCITRLAERVLPQSILYRYPFTDHNKRLLWNAVAELLLDLHEHGVYWGDPSLANVLMDLSGQRLTAVMADGETAQLVTGALDEGLRRQDLDAFVESLRWQAEDIRLARGLAEDQDLVTDDDAGYFLSRYAGLRAEHATASVAETGLFARLLHIERQARRISALGYGVLSFRARPRSLLDGAADEPEPSEGDHVEVATLRPGWYAHRLRELLGIAVPKAYAQRIYQHLNVHKWLLSEQAGHDVGMEAAARDWFETVHEPIFAFLRTLLPRDDPDALYAAYAAILDHTWRLSEDQQRPVPLEEGAMDYALAHAAEPPA